MDNSFNTLVDRTRTLVCYVDENEAATTLVESTGISPEEAFLTTIAAKLLNKWACQDGETYRADEPLPTPSE